MGERMHLFRNATGMTQTELSRLVEDQGFWTVSVRQVAALEGADGGASMASWHAVAHALGVPLSSFLEGDESSAKTAAGRPAKYHTGEHATDEQLEALMKAAGELSAKNVRSLLDVVLYMRSVKKR